MIQLFDIYMQKDNKNQWKKKKVQIYILYEYSILTRGK